MKFYCDKCNSKYAIADDKVRGKILKVRCKKCEHIITVREPTAPTPVAAPAPAPTARVNAPKARPQRPAPIAWFYAINGQTFGPFDADLLCAKYTAGEVGDASYVWHEGFEGWKPALEVEPFAGALRQGEALRPRHKTIGVSGAMEAISLADHVRHSDQEEEAGVAPSAAEPQPTLKALGRPHEPNKQADAPSQDLSARLGALRSRLRESRPLEALPASAQADPSALSAPGAEPDSLAALLDQARPAASTLSEESSVAEEAFAEESFAEDAFSKETFALSASASQPDALPSFDNDGMFGEDSAVLDSPSEASLDFSMMEQPSHMRESSLHIDHRSDDDFAPSQSLLIQLGDIQRKGRKQRVAVGGAIAAVLIAVFGVGLVVWSQSGDQNRFAEPGSSARVAQKDDLVINRYKKNELMTFGVEERLDVSALAEEPVEEPPVEAKAPAGAVAPRIRPLVVAQNDTPSRKPGLGINTRDLIGQDNLNAALRDSSTRGANGSSASANLRAAGQEGAPAALASAGNTPPRPKSGPDWDRLSAASPSAPMARAPLPDLNKAGGVAASASALTKDQLREGFKAIRGSVGRCYQSHTRRGLPFDSPKVAVTVEVQGNGRVSKVSFVPSNLGYTEFGQCMDAQRARWTFPEFQGDPLKVEHTYVLQ